MARISLEFGGGLDALFKEGSCASAKLSSASTVKELLAWISENALKDNPRADMLIQRGTVRPGVLVLVNDTDWEVLGGLGAALADGDTVTFISTLHGG